jgi:hypothetical protein
MLALTSKVALLLASRAQMPKYSVPAAAPVLFHTYVLLAE